MKTYQIKQELINKQNESLQRINIFITKDQYKKLLDLKYKYRLSFGLIIRIIANHYDSLGQVKEKCIEEQFYNTRTMRKTSLKIPKVEETTLNAKFYNNAAITYLEKYDKKFLDPKIYQKVRNSIANDFETTIDPLWEWDKFARYKYRMDKIQERQ